MASAKGKRFLVSYDELAWYTRLAVGGCLRVAEARPGTVTEQVPLKFLNVGPVAILMKPFEGEVPQLDVLLTPTLVGFTPLLERRHLEPSEIPLFNGRSTQLGRNDGADSAIADSARSEAVSERGLQP